MFVVIAAAMAYFYAWSARAQDVSWGFGQPQSDYYNLLVDGMLDGHLGLKVDVQRELLTIADPYNPTNRPPGIGLHDASFYRGHYYLYFGAAPVVTLLLPFRLLTHIALPLPAAVVAFVTAGYFVTAALWWAIRRRYFPESSAAVSALLLVALGTSSMVPVLARRANIWELPLASAYFYSSVAVMAIYVALHYRRSVWALAAAGLALGLAVASRPTFLYAAGLLVIPAFWLACRETTRAGRLRLILAAGIPFVVVGLLMALYNYARFGNPLEFGVAYQFSGIYEATTRHFSWTYFPYNFGLYFFGGFEWSRYFPFLHAAPHAVAPAGHFGIEEICGLWSHVPLLWFPLILVFPGLSRFRGDRNLLGVFASAVVALGVGTMLTLCFFYAAIGRYETDFAPSFALLGAIGVLTLEQSIRDAGKWIFRALRWMTDVSVVWSVLFAVVFSLTLYGNFRRLNPNAFAAFARIADVPARLLERFERCRIGPVAFDFRLPSDVRSGRESLAVVGWYKGWDAVYIEYGGDGAVRVGYKNAAGAVELSRWVNLDRAATHHLQIELGSLLPPYANGKDDAPLLGAASRVHVTIDGDVVLDQYRRFSDTAPDRLVIGGDAFGAGSGRPFSGFVTRVTRMGRPRQRVAGEAHVIEFRCRRANDRPQPLFSIDGKDTHVLGALEYRGGDMRFGMQGPEFKYRSSWIPASGASEHRVAVFSRENPWGQPGRFRSWLVLDGVPVWTIPSQEPLLQGGFVLGRRTFSAGGSDEVFDGYIKELGTLAGSSALRDFDRILLTVALPRVRPVHRHEPLVTAGISGAADFLYVEYLDQFRLRFGLEHWGKPAVFSEPITWPTTSVRELRIALGSFPGAAAAASQRGRITVSMDGSTVWDAEVRVFRAKAADIYIGENPLGGTACTATFTGEVSGAIYLTPGSQTNEPGSRRTGRHLDERAK